MSSLLDINPIAGRCGARYGIYQRNDTSLSHTDTVRIWQKLQGDKQVLSHSRVVTGYFWVTDDAFVGNLFGKTHLFGKAHSFRNMRFLI
jgi:hypothetical protein